MDTPAGRTTTADGAPVQSLSYEQARDELVAVVGRLEAGGETLEASLALWERGEQLAARCQECLDGARERLDRRVVEEQGPAQTAGATEDRTEDEDG
ncbi:exodeoxyribonuclease VII small subunit [Cellulomonas bogoriensis]|uniref:Exodeoxyribonuclease 7 small subunit n=1 Tax=Cellulomonas bogoriensis 69B4 = DSM 16987 TaxID=1386082 RepID=A0A0A0BZS9_9CELL|nr:exodeoxyribonuclease VII small subunit [Cellulomonas bogoriensis]KGM13903.1 exodeoxyribonuclease VII small subunit [Cellulomonas bogoriensis 69B4 = DSM 16987]